jgi:hypothetical protein
MRPIMAKIEGGVGKSHRTPGKHLAMDKIVGKTVGVHSRFFSDKVFVVVDCTAGDGVSSEFSKSTSPGIFNRHLEFLESKGIETRSAFYEKTPGSVELLRLALPNRNVIHGDSKDMTPIWGPGDVLLVSNDPNTINEWALPDALAAAPQLTTIFSTLGCNVGGLKRLPFEQRQAWYSHVRAQISLLQGWHDAYLVTLKGDAAQWAYLVNAPKKWRDVTEKAFASAFNGSKYEVEGAWFKQDRANFLAIVDYLFKTKKELSDV